MFADMEIENGLAAVASSTTFGSEAALWGAGAQFDWGEHWSARLDFQRFVGVGSNRSGAEADIDLLSLGVIYRL